MEHLYPQPTAKGIERTVRFYKHEYGKDITEDEARQILAKVIHFLWLSAHLLTDAQREKAAQVEADMAEAAARADRARGRTGIRAYPEEGGKSANK
jgi:hypothetical protein